MQTPITIYHFWARDYLVRTTGNTGLIIEASIVTRRLLPLPNEVPILQLPGNMWPQIAFSWFHGIGIHVLQI